MIDHRGDCNAQPCTCGAKRQPLDGDVLFRTLEGLHPSEAQRKDIEAMRAKEDSCDGGQK